VETGATVTVVVAATVTANVEVTNVVEVTTLVTGNIIVDDATEDGGTFAVE